MRHAQRRKYYKCLYGFTVRFETDDISAFRITKHFQDMLRILGFPPAKEMVIEKYRLKEVAVLQISSLG